MVFKVQKVGGDERNRTADPLLARQVLSQLSYAPTFLLLSAKTCLVGLSGLEPLTSRLSGVRSNQLSYKPILKSFDFSGDEEIRTLDPLLARQVLSQLSYTPMDAGLPSFEAIPYSFMFCIYFNQPVTCCITFSGNGLKWTRTTDLTLIRRAL